MPTRNVVITDHQAALIERLVASGRYQNASEVLREGLRLIEARDAEHAARVKAFEAAIAEGVAALDRGDFVEVSSEAELKRFMDGLEEA